MLKCTRLLLVACAGSALALAGCGEAEETAGSEGLYGSADFILLMEDARYEANRGDLAKAGELLDQARELEPENPGLWVDIARLRFRGGEHLPALQAADYALELGPEYAPALLLRAQLVRDAHGMADAVPWFEAAVSANPDNVDLLAEYAATLGDLGRHSDMLAVVRKLHEVAEGHPQVFYLQAVLAARAGEPVLARSLLRRSGKVERDIPAALMLGALIDIQQSNYDNAATTLENLAERQSSNARMQELLARAWWLNGRDQELIERFGDRVTAPDASPYLTMLVGRALERQGEREQAAPIIERALMSREVQWAVLGGGRDLAPSLPRPTSEMRQLVDAESGGETRRFANELVDRFSGSSDAHALAGDAALARGDAEGALEMYRIAATVRRPWPLTRKVITAYRAYGDNKAADTILIRHLRGEPRNVEALLMLAERRALAEDWLRVVVLLDQAKSLGGGNDPKLLNLQAEALAQIGRGEEAEAVANDARAISPSGFVDG
ncbi:MAG: tetratricopeptide repeat protein, partial [Pseudomonadota bacterium]